jgi:hypothetical protein
MSKLTTLLALPWADIPTAGKLNSDGAHRFSAAALRRGTGSCVFGLFIAVSTCLAQGRVDEFLGVQSWHGTVTITGSGSGSTAGGIYSDVWQYGVTSSANIELPTAVANIQGWTGTFTGNTAVNASDIDTTSGCVETLTQMAQVPLGIGKAFTMHLQGTNQYVFYPSDYEADGGTNTTTLSCAPGSLGGSVPVTWSPVLSSHPNDLPATGFSLKGSFTTTMNSPMQPLALVFGGTAAVITVTVTWDFEPGSIAGLEVVVPSTAAFQNFRPTAGNNGARGNSLDLTAKLQAKGGGAPFTQAAYFTWELTQSSKEPGYAMNMPPSNPGTDFDLKIESGSPAFLTLDPTGQKAQTLAGQFTQATATIASYDWGAFGKIKVTAVMPDGEQIVGYLEGDTSQTEIRLPKRSDSSLIADVWKQNNGTLGQADINDNESDPPGDGNGGDGLTLYEEYRGFIIGGAHEEGNPNIKDYFIVNTGGASYQPGIKLFQSLSGLKVHYNLKRSEMTDTRVINSNHDQGAHRVDQHAVLVVPFASNPGYAEALGGPGTPKSIAVVNAPQQLPNPTQHSVDYLASTLAHELFHACNVYHHGDAGYPTVSWQRLPTGVVLENGTTPVTLRDEAGADASVRLPELTVVPVNLGVANDPHTGDDSCVMRYDDAHGYYPDAGPPAVRYFTPTETAGTGLCAQSEGTGVNEPGRQPQPRYGNAVRGNCVGQLLVNDAIAAPKR